MADAQRPTILVEPGTLDRQADAAETAILQAGRPIFQRGRRLVRPATQDVPASRGRSTTAACLIELTQASLIDEMAGSAKWVRWNARAKTEAPADPPKQVADILLSRFGAWSVPSVVGVVTTPTIRPDRSLMTQPGYDAATRLYLVPDPKLDMPSIKEIPSRADAKAALDLLDGLLSGFPFVTEVDRSVALSGLLTPVCRGAISVAPLHVFRASTAGTGKSFLVDLASAIATGRHCAVAAAGSKPAETESRLNGLLLGGFPIVSLDNVNGEIGSDLLCQAVERPTVRLRPLGTSDIREIETRATFYATGNGLRVRGDMTRRSLICDLDAGLERPELRTFSFDPVETALSDRGKYVAAALTVVAAFLASGEKPPMTALASYGDWSATVRGALVWLGRPDPALSMEAAREDDPELAELRDLMLAWAAVVGVKEPATLKRVVAYADERQRDPETGHLMAEYRDPALRDALMTVASERGSISTARLGKWLRGRKGRIVSLALPNRPAGQYRFEAPGETGGVARWVLRER